MAAAKHRTKHAVRPSRALAKPLPGPVGVATTVRVVDRTVIDRYDLMDDDGKLHFPIGDRVIVETDSAKPAWLVRWHELPPSQNELMRRYSNVHAYQALVRNWESILWAAAQQAPIPKASVRRRMEITRFIRAEKYRLDRGNLVGGCKPLLDAAVQIGLLLDDREEHLDDHYRQAIDACERVEILISNA